MKQPILLSLILPIRNEKYNLIYMCESIVHQTYKDKFEVILIDDSEEYNEYFIKKCLDSLGNNGVNVRYVRGPGRGVGAAMLTGLSLSEGIYILFLDADNMLASNFMRELLPFFDAGFFVSFLSKSLDDIKGIPGLLYASNLLATFRKSLRLDWKHGFVNTLYIWRREVFQQFAKMKYPLLSLLDQIDLKRVVEEHEKRYPRKHLNMVLVYDIRHKFDAIIPLFIYRRLLWYYSAVMKKFSLKNFVKEMKDPILLVFLLSIFMFMVIYIIAHSPLVMSALIASYILPVLMTMKINVRKPSFQFLLGLLWLPILLILKSILAIIVLVKLTFKET